MFNVDDRNFSNIFVLFFFDIKFRLESLYFFVDGTLVAQWITPTTYLASNVPLFIGRAAHSDTRQLAGKVACLQIYNRVLNGEEIQDAMTCPWTSRFIQLYFPLTNLFLTRSNSNDVLADGW